MIVAHDESAVPEAEVAALVCKPDWIARHSSLVLVLILAAATLLRLHGLSALPLWVDEAESCINALTILQHGVPTDSYLGLPIFENTLIKEWPGNDEYEFRDVSYSDKGLAIYHGWLPLYSISGSFLLFGITPDQIPATVPRYSATDRRYRTVVARLPSVFFSVLSVTGLYLAAVRLHSVTAGLIAAALVAFGTIHITLGQQARYYAATLAISSLCAWSACRMVQQRRLRDFCLGGVFFSLLFHTHLLTFAAMCCFLSVYMLASFGRELRQRMSGICAFVAIIIAATVPWLLGTGFLPHTARIPQNWQTMTSFRDFIVMPVLVSEYGALLLMGSLLLFATMLPRRPEWANHLAGVITPPRLPLTMVYAWMVLAYASFVICVPVASFAISRLALVLLVPATLIIAMLIASLSELFSATRRSLIRVSATVLFLGVSNYAHANASRASEAVANLDLNTAITFLASAGLRPTTKVFASPNEHLVLTFYTGIPVQSIAPVRKSFFDHYSGEIVFLEKMDLSPTRTISVPELQSRAARAGVPLDEHAAGRLSCDLASLTFRRDLARGKARVVPEPQPAPSFVGSALGLHDEEMRRRGRLYDLGVASRLPIFRNMHVYTIYDWWTGFFYRFVDPERRRQHPAFEDRFRGAVSFVPPCSNWVIRLSPPPQTHQARF